MRDSIRLATVQDAAALLQIYSPIVRDTNVSFELEPPVEREFQARMSRVLGERPWLVYEREGQIVGYAYATAYRARPAYAWSVEVSVYVSPEAQGAGVGSALYRSLLKILGQQGFVSAYAGITLPNPASVALHEAVGFEPVGVFRAAGFKLGKWHDVGWWQYALANSTSRPDAPRSLAVLDRHTLAAALRI